MDDHRLAGDTRDTSLAERMRERGEEGHIKCGPVELGRTRPTARSCGLLLVHTENSPRCQKAESHALRSEKLDSM